MKRDFIWNSWGKQKLLEYAHQYKDILTKKEYKLNKTLKNFIDNLEKRAKDWYSKNSGRVFIIRYEPFKFRLSIRKDRFGRIDFCKQSFCFKELRLYEEDFCSTHRTTPLKFRSITRTIWTAKRDREREKYAAAILQPFDREGIVNPHYVKLYGDPRKIKTHANHPRNIWNKYYMQNLAANRVLEQYEFRKYGI